MSIKKNFAFNSILALSSYIFPLLTYPYVSRVLGVSNLGIYNFVDNIINYFIMLSMLGINAIGVREIAKYKSDPIKLQVSFSNLFLLNAFATLFAIIVLIIITLNINQLYLHKEMMFFGGVKLVFNLFLTEWFFNGIENFRYITIRSLCVKVVYVISVFIFIKTKDDFLEYYILSSCMIIVNSLFNIRHRVNFVKFSFADIQFGKYLKSFVNIGSFMVLTSLYTTFNMAYLGFTAGTKEVGYYSTATKLYQIFLSLFTAFTSVMLPRISALASSGDFEQVKKLTNKSYDLLLTFCLPIIIITGIFAPQIILLISGEGYEGAITPMRIVMPLMLIIGIEQILVVQLLLPLKKDRQILINSIIGAIVGLSLNFLLVKTYKSVGSSAVWLISELVVLTSSQYFVKKSIGINFPYLKILNNIIQSIPIIIICCTFQIENFWENELLDLAVSIFLSIIYYGWLQLFWLKNAFILSILKKNSLIKTMFSKL